MVKVGQTHRRHDAGEARDGGAMRKRATGHGRGRAWARWRALAPARRVVRLLGRGEAGADDGELQGGGRSSGTCGFGVVVLGRGSWWVLRAPGEVWSTVVCPASSHSGSGHDGDEARRRRASAAAELWPRARKREGRERGSARRLTAEL